MPPEQPIDPEIPPKPAPKRQPKPAGAEQPPAKPRRTAKPPSEKPEPLNAAAPTPSAKKPRAKTSRSAPETGTTPSGEPATPKPKRASSRSRKAATIDTLGGTIEQKPGEPELFVARTINDVSKAPSQVDLASAPISVTDLPSIEKTIRDVEHHRGSLFGNPTFLAFWLSRFLVQAAQGALMYGLLVLVVDSTDSSIFNSIFVVCSVIPAIIFGLPAGVAVDALPRRPLLVALNLLRFLFVLALVVRPPSIAGIFATTLAIWLIHQFYAPAESSTLASIVPRTRLVDGQALSNLALVVAQAVGVIAIAPLLLKTANPSYLFAVCAAFFLTAAALVFQIHIDELKGQLSQMSRHPDGILATLLRGMRVTIGGSVLFRVTAADVMVGIGLSALVVVAPIYLKRILDTSSENTVFVFAPAAIGVLFGLRAAPYLGRYLGLRWVAIYGLALFALSIAAFGFLGDIYWILVDTFDIPIDRIAHSLHLPPLALLVMLFSIPAGFASSIVGIASRTITLERTPLAFRGQVIATQSLVQNMGALVPTMLAGIAADQLGVERVAIIIALLIVTGIVVAFFISRPPDTSPAPA
ncbi:MAG: MFS transporter [Thermomicrobiales bacterium]|nr:MAG: MFS transporter [Thermomicrobiales bacterium]